MPKKLKTRTFEVEVQRKAVGFRTFRVEADGKADAKDKAVAEAAQDDWTDISETEYDAFSVHEAE
jgi:hypothetical protein